MKTFSRAAAPLALCTLIGMFLCLAPQIARAQPRCWGSSLIYILRDERGKRIDADQSDLWIGPGWQSVDYDFGESWVELPKALRNEIGNLKFLAHIERSRCSFTKPIELRLTLRGKSMNLVFHAENKNYVIVDSLPFQPGIFEHQLSPQPGQQTVSWPAQEWKKIGDKAEAVAPYPLAVVRGRVMDSASGKPVPNARLILKSNVSYKEATTNTGARGAFTLKVRADGFEKATRLAVVATQPDYLDDFAIAVENRQGGPLQSLNNVNVELVRAVTLSGRVINEKTGVAPSPKDEVKLGAEYPGSKDLWGIKIGGKTEYVDVKPDGTFLIKTGIGKNLLRIDSYGFCYKLKDDQKELDVGPQGRSQLVLTLVAPGCKPF